jgi:surface protein
MKTKLLLGLATAAMLTACSNDELVSVNADNSNAIGFSTFVNKSTRATDITNSNLGDFNFAVYGYTKASADDAAWEPIFLNEKVYGSGTVNNGDGSWQYDNLQYWEEGNSYHFHAIAPYGIDATTVTSGDTLTTQRNVRHWEYEAGETTTTTGDGDNATWTTTSDYSKAKITFTNIDKGKAAGEQDLIYAYKYAEGKAKDETNGEVQFEFKHLLSRVKFQFKGAASNPASVKIKVKEVTLEGTYSDGSIEIEAGKDAAWTLDADKTSNLSFGCAGTANTENTAVTETALVNSESDAVTTIETAHKYIIPDVENSVEYIASFKCEIEAAVNGGGSKTYTVISKGNKLPPVQMKEGYSYIYQITLDASTDDSNNLIQPILFNVTEIQSWDNNDWVEVKKEETPKENYVIETIELDSGQNQVQILGDNFNIEQVKEMYIDDSTTSITPTPTYNFAAGKHTVKIVLKEGNEFSSAKEMFYDCSDITKLYLSNFDTSNVTDMSGMFYGCNNLTSLDVSKFDTGNVTTMYGMFWNCSNLTTLDVSKFDTGNVTTMYCMFYTCTSLTSLDVSKFDTSNVTDMSGMFKGCSSLTSLDVSKFDTGNVTTTHGMFEGCSSLTSLDVTNFNTSKVQQMNYMFFNCPKLTSLDVTQFDTGKVTNMKAMFGKCSGLTSLDVTGFDTKNVTNMYGTFYCCTNLTSLDVTKFNTSNVTTMEMMFYECSSLTSLDLSSFNTLNVTNMEAMFEDCTKLTSVTMKGGLNANVSVSDIFAGAASNGTFTYSNGDYTKIITALPKNWTTKEQTD